MEYLYQLEFNSMSKLNLRQSLHSARINQRIFLSKMRVQKMVLEKSLWCFNNSTNVWLKVVVMFAFFSIAETKYSTNFLFFQKKNAPLIHTKKNAQNQKLSPTTSKNPKYSDLRTNTLCDLFKKVYVFNIVCSNRILLFSFILAPYARLQSLAKWWQLFRSNVFF